MDIRTIFIDEPSFGSGRLSVASSDVGEVHVELAIMTTPRDRAAGQPGDGAFIVAASSSGLQRLSLEWGTLMVLGVTTDPDTFVADLNARFYGDHVLTPDIFSPFEVQPGFNDYYPVALALGPISWPDGIGIRDGHMHVTLPAALPIEAFAQRFAAAMADFEFENAARAPAFIEARFESGLALLAPPRFTAPSPNSVSRATRIYLVDLDTLATEIARRTDGIVTKARSSALARLSILD